MKLLSLPYFNGTFEHALDLKVFYDFGGKFKDITDFTPAEKGVDCSGFIRWFLYHASNGAVLFPDGSVNQNEWCKHLKLPRFTYGIAALNRTGAAFICFKPPTKGKAGHVWIIRNGRTIESYGGKGIGSRSALTHILLLRCRDCYRIL